MKCPNCGCDFKVIRKEHPTKDKVNCNNVFCHSDNGKRAKAVVFNFIKCGKIVNYYCIDCAFEKRDGEEFIFDLTNPEYMKRITDTTIDHHFIYVFDGLGTGDKKFLEKFAKENLLKSSSSHS